VHLLVNELCEYQNARCNDKNYVYGFKDVEAQVKDEMMKMYGL